jgi:hypothetical protein
MTRIKGKELDRLNIDSKEDTRSKVIEMMRKEVRKPKTKRTENEGRRESGISKNELKE